MDTFWAAIEAELNRAQALAPRVVAALVVFTGVVLVGRALGRALQRFLERGHLARAHAHFFAVLVRWIAMACGGAIVLGMLGLGQVAMGLLTGGSLAVLAFGFAFRDLGENLMAGLSLAFGRPFDVGDLIRCGAHQGVVQSVELRSTHVRTEDGCDVFIPNAALFTNALENFTRDDLRRVDCRLGIDYGDDANAACALLLAEVHSVDDVLETSPSTVRVGALGSQTVDLEVQFWVDVRAAGRPLAAVRHDVLVRCRRALVDNGYTVSSNVSTAVVLAGASGAPVSVQLRPTE